MRLVIGTKFRPLLRTDFSESVSGRFYGIVITVLWLCNVVSILVQSIRAKIRQLNSGLFDHLHQTKTLKLQQLIGPQITDDTTLHSHMQLIIYLYTQSFLIAKVFKHLNTFSINALSKNVARKHSSALPN